MRRLPSWGKGAEVMFSRIRIENEEIVGCVLSWLRYISNATDVIDGMRQLCLAGNWVMGSVYGAPICRETRSRWKGV